jgi:hypothetical protein
MPPVAAGTVGLVGVAGRSEAYMLVDLVGLSDRVMDQLAVLPVLGIEGRVHKPTGVLGRRIDYRSRMADTAEAVHGCIADADIVVAAVPASFERHRPVDHRGYGHIIRLLVTACLAFRQAFLIISSV